MRTVERTTRWGRLAGLAVGATALGVTLACSGTPAASGAGPGVEAQAAQQAGAPVLVGCEPHQRALVRPAIVNGIAVSQVECVAVPGTPAPAPAAMSSLHAPAAPPAYAPARTAYAPAPAVSAPPPPRRPAPQPVYDDLGDARVVQTASRSARTVPARQVIYDEPRPRTRSAAKSAVIIGSSAGAGAGVGAVVGGRKGALIGAAVGGGGAAVWDQVTRRK